ncbi:MAG: DoxX family protein [Rhodospirillaceae bacterium]|nr:DoxX family protein [Rhodospirillaceae bacterium]
MTALALNRLTETAATSSVVKDTLPLVGRVFLATIFVFSGLGKIAAAEPTIGYIAASGLPFPVLAYAGAVAVEVGLGLALIVGFQTRIAALVLAGFSLVTAVVFHSAFGDQNQLIHFLKNIGLAGGLLQVASLGAGGFSIDAKQRRI